MNQKKIKELEEETKKLYYNPKLKKHSFSKEKTKELFTTLWDYHIKPVIEMSKKMAKKYDANLEVVWLASILHDIVRLEDAEPHDVLGAKKAKNILTKRGFDKKIISEVSKAILTHRCKQYPPKNLEQKIIATADAMAHFIPPIYFWMNRFSKMTFSETLSYCHKKLERDYNEKIFFKEEKKIVKNQYEVLKNWLTYKTN